MSRKVISSAPLLVVAAGDLDRIAGVAQLDEIDALDHATGLHVQAGMMRLASIRRPRRPNRSFAAAQLVRARLRGGGEVQRALVDGAAGDRAHDALVLDRAQPVDVVAGW